MSSGRVDPRYIRILFRVFLCILLFMMFGVVSASALSIHYSAKDIAALEKIAAYQLAHGGPDLHDGKGGYIDVDWHDYTSAPKPYTVRELHWDGKGLQGELDLTELSSLSAAWVGHNQLTGIKVRGLRSLSLLEAFANQLTTLDLTGLENLETLEIGYNELTQLDLHSVKNLKTLDVTQNYFKNLDVTHLAQLNALYVDRNKLRDLNVSNLKKLKFLSCSNNLITNVRMANMESLQNASFGSNVLKSLTITGLANPLRGLEAEHIEDFININDKIKVNTRGNGYISIESQFIQSKLENIIVLEANQVGTAFYRWTSGSRLYSVERQISLSFHKTYNLTAHFTMVVEFDSCGGSKVAHSRPYNGEKLVPPKPPTKKGYIFLGWYKDPSYQQKWDFDKDIVTDFIMLYARWDKLVTGVSLSKKAITIEAGQSVVLEATVKPSSVEAKDVSWKSSNTSIAKVAANGTVTGVKAGTATITATTVNGKKTASCKVKVTPKQIALESLKFKSDALLLKKGKTEALQLIFLPVDASNKNITWKSSNSKIASVDAKGRVKGIKNGVTTISAISKANSQIKAECKVFVDANPIQVSAISISPAVSMLTSASKLTFTVNIKPSKASIKDVTWSSSDTTVATINAKGSVVARQSGTAVITCTSLTNSKVKAQATVIVPDANTYIPPTGVALSNDALRLEVGETTVLSADVMPNTATVKYIIWSSKKKSVAAVDENGKVTGVSPGVAIIRTSTLDGNHSASCTVTVFSAVTKVETLQKKVYINVGSQYVLPVIALTKDGSTAKLTWESSAPTIVTVNGGKVTGLKKGKAIVKATAENGKTVDITIMVGSGKNITSLSIKNAPKNATMKVGDKKTLDVSFQPSDAQGAVTFKSSTPKVVAIDRLGRVNALAKGQSTITVAMGKKKATFKITVK